jgi:hypothetical protein
LEKFQISDILKVDREVQKKNFFENFTNKVIFERRFGLFIILSYSWTKHAHSPLFSAL